MFNRGASAGCLSLYLGACASQTTFLPAVQAPTSAEAGIPSP